MEQWKKVKDYPDYEVSDQGRVRSYKRSGPPQILQNVCSNYCQVSLYNEHGVRNFLVHLLVIKAFIGPRPDGCEADHENGKHRDNKLSNLRWLEVCANRKHRFKPKMIEKARSQKIWDDLVKRFQKEECHA